MQINYITLWMLETSAKSGLYFILMCYKKDLVSTT